MKKKTQGNNNRKRALRTAMLAVMTASMLPINVYAGWVPGIETNTGRWWYAKEDGTWHSNGWQWIDGNLDGVAECYYFDAEGWMAANGMTPDGYTVNADGAWTENGVVQTRLVAVGQGTGAAAGSRTSGGGGGGSSSSSVKVSTSYTYNDDDFYAYGSSYSSAELYNERNLSSSRKREVQDAIAEFKDEYITSDMSDFEKELKIVQWMVDNIEYDYENYKQKTIPSESYTSYGALVLGEAVCSGYANAFQQMASACGLTTKIVESSTHAWNMIKLDGKWYHVDVTWEDPVPSNDYGWNNLRNKYINLTDSQISSAAHHKSWSPNNDKATGTAYGADAVTAYFAPAKEAEKAAQEAKKQEERTAALNNWMNQKAAASKAVLVEYTTVEDTAAQIVNLIQGSVDNKDASVSIMINYGTEAGSYYGEYGNYSAASRTQGRDRHLALQQEILNAVNRSDFSAMSSDLDMSKTSGFAALQKQTNVINHQDTYYYSTGTMNLYYKEGTDTVNYVLHMVDSETGEPVGDLTGTTNRNTTLRLFPATGYKFLADSLQDVSGTHNSLRNYSNSITFKISSKGDYEATIQVENTKAAQEAQKTTAAQKAEENKTEHTNGQTEMTKDAESAQEKEQAQTAEAEQESRQSEEQSEEADEEPEAERSEKDEEEPEEKLSEKDEEKTEDKLSEKAEEKLEAEQLEEAEKAEEA